MFKLTIFDIKNKLSNRMQLGYVMPPPRKVPDPKYSFAISCKDSSPIKDQDLEIATSTLKDIRAQSSIRFTMDYRWDTRRCYPDYYFVGATVKDIISIAEDIKKRPYLFMSLVKRIAHPDSIRIYESLKFSKSQTSKEDQDKYDKTGLALKGDEKKLFDLCCSMDDK